MKPLASYTEADLRAMPIGAEMDGLVYCAIGGIDGVLVWAADLPAYSTSPGAAFEALIGVNADDWNVSPYCTSASKFTGMGGIEWKVSSETGDIARDICIAILLAKRSETP